MQVTVILNHYYVWPKYMYMYVQRAFASLPILGASKFVLGKLEVREFMPMPCLICSPAKLTVADL